MLELLIERLSSTSLNFNLVEIFLVFSSAFLIWRYIYSRPRNKLSLPSGPVGLPFVGYIPFLGAEPHKTFVSLTKKYGEIIGLYLGRRYTIVLNEYNVMKETISHPAAMDKASNIFEHIPHTGFTSANGEEWVEQRRFCLFAAKDLGLGSGPWENLILEEVNSFIEELKSFQERPVDISDHLSSSISSNIISLLIGRRLDKEKEKDKIKLSVEHAEFSLTYAGPANVASIMPWTRKYLEFFKISGYYKAAKAIQKFHYFVKGEIARHKTTSEFKNSHDFINSYRNKMSEMVSQQNVKHFFTDENLEGNLNVLFLGGSDTIFSSLTWLFRLMIKYPDIQEKVHKEIMEVLGKDGIARYGERQKIPYTFAVIMESQRFSSIVPISTTRIANSDFTIKGYDIPKGADISPNLWALHNDPKYWKEPEKFVPERFLTDNGTTLIMNPPSYAPFSLGRRNCPGQTIAWMEILSYFSETIKNFEICVPPNEKPDLRVINGLVARLQPQPMCFKKRIDSC